MHGVALQRRLPQPSLGPCGSGWAEFLTEKHGSESGKLLFKEENIGEINHQSLIIIIKHLLFIGKIDHQSSQENIAKSWIIENQSRIRKISPIWMALATRLNWYGSEGLPMNPQTTTKNWHWHVSSSIHLGTCDVMPLISHVWPWTLSRLWSANSSRPSSASSLAVNHHELNQGPSWDLYPK